MSRLMITSDLHLGHDSAIKWRTQFSTPEEHHNTLFENLATNIGKRDTLIMLGDMALSLPWHSIIGSIKCKKKILILGNHDTERVNIRDIVYTGAYDEIHSLYSKRNMWFSHCPIHEDQFRDKILNIHGHLHENLVSGEGYTNDEGVFVVDDPRYFNACVEQTDYKPISFQEILERVNARGY